MLAFINCIGEPTESYKSVSNRCMGFGNKYMCMKQLCLKALHCHCKSEIA